MAKVIKVCRVCGKKYEACQMPAIINTFRWQDVSCSPKCGAEYLHRVRVARGEIEDVKNEPVINPEGLEEVIYSDNYYGFEGEIDEDYMTEFGE